MFLLSSLTNEDSYNTQIIQCVKDTIFRKRFLVYSVLEAVLELQNRFLGTGSYVKSPVGQPPGAWAVGRRRTGRVGGRAADTARWASTGDTLLHGMLNTAYDSTRSFDSSWRDLKTFLTVRWRIQSIRRCIHLRFTQTWTLAYRLPQLFRTFTDAMRNAKTLPLKREKVNPFAARPKKNIIPPKTVENSQYRR